MQSRCVSRIMQVHVKCAEEDTVTGAVDRDFICLIKGNERWIFKLSGFCSFKALKAFVIISDV